MAGIERISSGAPWEPIFGYSRAVKAGGWLAVAGTTSIDENGRIVGRNQMYVQARQAIANIAAALERAGMTLADVVRTRVFVTDMQRFSEVARAHLEAFGGSPPASTVVEIRRLVNPDLMIEIEADAYLAPNVAAAEVVEDAIEVEAVLVATSTTRRPSRSLKATAAVVKSPATKSKVGAKPHVAAKTRSPKTKPAMVAKTPKATKKIAAKAPRKPFGKRR
jgi:enamine deaminase RidA (YjgF/YER057c/UK114 family)